MRHHGLVISTDDVLAPSFHGEADTAAQTTGEPATPAPDLAELEAPARSAAEVEAGRPGSVGGLLEVHREDPVAVTVAFAATDPGYLGWHWSVTLAVIAGDPPTVSEVVLLPGPRALIAPAWVPWEERIRPGDLGPGDLLPPIEDDPRVVPAYLESDDPAVEAVAHELGVGRVRVLSRIGRVDAAERWHDGDFGPGSEAAKQAPGRCVTCAFYLPLAGSLGALVGACGNEMSPGDGRVVDAGYGCGAHSETVLDLPSRAAMSRHVIDELRMEVHSRPATAAGEPAAEPATGPDETEEPKEPLADPGAAGPGEDSAEPAADLDLAVGTVEESDGDDPDESDPSGG